MNLLEKVSQLREERVSLTELVGMKVSVNVEGRDIKGIFRQFQSNGLANIYLEESYKTPKGKETKWIKAPQINVSIL